MVMVIDGEDPWWDLRIAKVISSDAYFRWCDLESGDEDGPRWTGRFWTQVEEAVTDARPERFIPKRGQKVRVIGNCHPALMGVIATVKRVDVEDDYVELEYLDQKFGKLSTGGCLGGLEPA